MAEDALGRVHELGEQLEEQGIGGTWSPEWTVVNGVLTFTGGLVAVTVEDNKRIALSDDVTVPRSFRVDRYYTAEGPDVTLIVNFDKQGTPHRELRVRDASTTLMRKLGLERLFDQASAGVARTRRGRQVPVGPGNRLFDVPAGFPYMSADPEALGAVRYSRRARISPEDVTKAADAYRTGGIEAVKAALFKSDRQAWRYVALAQEAGLLERQRPKRKQTSKRKAKR